MISSAETEALAHAIAVASAAGATANSLTNPGQASASAPAGKKATPPAEAKPRGLTLTIFSKGEDRGQIQPKPTRNVLLGGNAGLLLGCFLVGFMVSRLHACRDVSAGPLRPNTSAGRPGRSDSRGLRRGIMWGALDSVPVVVAALVPLAIRVVIYAPETLLVLLAAQGTLKAVPALVAPREPLVVTLGLCVACVSACVLPASPLSDSRPSSWESSSWRCSWSPSLRPYRAGRTRRCTSRRCASSLVALMVSCAASRPGCDGRRFVVIGLVVAHVATPGSSPG